MEMVVVALGVVAILLTALALGVWVFAALALAAILSLWGFGGFGFERIGLMMSKILFRASNSWELAAIPLFIFMGELIFRSDISERLFRGLAPLTRYLPGGLLHTNVFGSTLFASVCGSSAATTATVGKFTTRELANRGYNRDLSLGSLAGAGSLGLLIPPSIIMIVYGVQAEVSIIKLFMAGLLPGLMMAALFSAFIIIRAVANARVVPREPRGDTRLLAAVGLLMPILLLIGLVVGAIYSGIATPSESAAIGVTASLLLLLAERQLSVALILDALKGTLLTSAMVCSLLVAAAMLSAAMAYLHLPRELAAWIAAQQLSPVLLLLAIALFYVLLGMFLDGISLTVMSLPITLPVIVAAGYDPIWFGVFLVIMVELGQITPPVGFNLFVIQSLSGEPIGRVAMAALPFFLLMCLAAVMITGWPQIALWLPEVLSGG